MGLSHLYVKDESRNPTGSFKARGLAAAVSKAKELGVEKVIIPTAGNAGGARAAYAMCGIKGIYIYTQRNTVRQHSSAQVAAIYAVKERTISMSLKKGLLKGLDLPGLGQIVEEKELLKKIP